MTQQLDPHFAASLRGALVHHVNNTALAPRKRTRKFWMAGSAVLAVGLAGGSAAIAQDFFAPPGGTETTPVSGPTTVTASGPAVINLGARPADADVVTLTMTCLSAGTITFTDGSSLSCSADDAQPASPTPAWSMPLEPGQTTITVTSTNGMEWSLTATYSQQRTTDWGLNARGQTFGVTRPDGSTPDLVAAYATNGVGGYVLQSDLNAAVSPPDITTREEALEQQQTQQGNIELPVYAEDGLTVVGTYVVLN